MAGPLIPVCPPVVRVGRPSTARFGAIFLCQALLLAGSGVGRAGAQVGRPDSVRQRPRPDSALAPTARTDTLPADSLARSAQGADSALSVNLLGRLEFKGERTSNDRCLSNQLFSATFRCKSRLTPQLDFQFSLTSAGTVADRVKVNVDYDSQREFDGSNNISIAYEGRPGEFLQRLEVGNVSFAPPPSQFLTAGIPAGNYGVQVAGEVGGMRFSAIAAQQKGNVARDQVFTVGGRTTQTLERDIQDYEVEARRFFFTVDPALFGARYPNLDLLDPGEMAGLAASLPDSLRPSRVSLYRLVIGGQPPNPNGPRFQLLGSTDVRSGQPYELLREGVDYYIDPTQLWFALVRPLSLANERLVAAWTLRVGGRDTTIARLGGTPDLEVAVNRTQYAHLIWDPQVTPDDPAFRRSIRSIYRLGGSDVRRETVELRLVAGGADQEKPPGVDATYLEIFGLAQGTNRARFDLENRLWPRPQDPNVLIGAPTGQAAALIRDVFIVFPSLEPFARRGLASAPSVVPNDTIYRTPEEYLNSPQHPQSFYRMRTRYASSGGDGGGLITLAAVQLRPGSERLAIDGRPLVRDVDYRIDYDLGRVQLLTVDTLSARPRRVTVQYEETPLFTSVPTTLAGLTTEWRLPAGSIAFTALSQSQRTTFTRPPLGYEPQGSLVAGLTASLGWALPGVSRRLAALLPGADSAAASRLDVRAEAAISRPHQSGGQQAYIESFEGEGGITVNLLESQWQLSSQPALGARLAGRLGAETLDTTRASTLAFQNYGTDANGRAVTFSIQQIDPLTALPGGALAGPEQMLWLTLYPLTIGGLRDTERSRYRWNVVNVPSGRRWRSIRTPLGPGGNGVDLSRAEHLEFWTLVDTAGVRRGRNPTLILDFGDVSENSVAFAPESLRVRGADSVWTGKQLQGFDRLDSERDPFSRAFSADVNDKGLPGDVVRPLFMNVEGFPIVAIDHPICLLGSGRALPLGDARANCTVRNSRLDEEDIDQDAVLNYTSAQREQERVRRYVVDLGDPANYNRIGRCGVTVSDINTSTPAGVRLCWVQVRLPFSAPEDEIAGGPLVRRVRALRLTMVSGAQAADNQFTLTPIARLRVVGALWTKRAARPLRGLGGEEQTLGGYVIASVIGTQDRDSTRGLIYEPPPGVTDEPELQGTVFGVAGAPINERSMRILAGGIPRHGRAEAFLRFPEGPRNVMSYRELRVWARGRGKGWGLGGDLEFLVKLGRDANNFYAYHTPVASGATRAAWEPEIRVRFARFYALRARLTEAYLEGRTDFAGCTAADSALILASSLPVGATARRYAACEDGYVVYTVDPAVTPPNLAAVQELAAGIVRVDSLRGPNPPLAGDTLELWVDDIRLVDAREDIGYAGLFGATLTAGDVGSVRLHASRRDPNFRQLGERPSFLTSDDFEFGATWFLDKLLPWRLGISAPLTVTHTAAASDPVFLSDADILGEGVRLLRTPRRATTVASLAVRRSTPLRGGWLSPIMNNLALTATWNGSGSRTEYQKGRARGVDLGVDYLFAGPTPGSGDAGAGTFDLAGAASGLAGQAPQGTGPRRVISLTPSLVRFSSSFVAASDRLEAFVKPAGAPDDGARHVDADQRLWRSATSVEFKPVSAVTARWDVATLRDLREYGALFPNAAVAAGERVTMAGIDVGVERERNLSASILISPPGERWLRPRLELSSGYSMLRDPNAPALPDPAGGSDLRLARRFGNSQRAAATAVLDVPLALVGLGVTDDRSILAAIARAIGAIELGVTRDQLTSYDASPLNPGLSYQWGFGGIDAFREIRNVLAASAGAGTGYSASNTLALPFGATIAQRAQRTDSRHWSRRLQDRQSLIDGVQSVFPDVTLRWSGRPAALDVIFSNLAATARLVHSRQAFVSPSEITGRGDEVRATRMRTYPLSLSAVSADGAFSLTGSLSRTQRVDSLPGSVGESETEEVSADVARAFPLPRGWQLRSGLRTRLSYQRSETRSYVSNIAAIGARSRLTDNGRRVFRLNADTDVAENLTFSLQGSRVVTFDRNFNRRFTQTVISAVLNIQFFGGVLR